MSITCHADAIALLEKRTKLHEAFCLSKTPEDARKVSAQWMTEDCLMIVNSDKFVGLTSVGDAWSPIVLYIKTVQITSLLRQFTENSISFTQTIINECVDGQRFMFSFDCCCTYDFVKEKFTIEVMNSGMDFKLGFEAGFSTFLKNK